MISHHPGDETLLRFATGDLPAGPALVVATHIDRCEACCALMRMLERVGGATLDASEPVSLDVSPELALLLDDPEAALQQRATRRAASDSQGGWTPTQRRDGEPRRLTSGSPNLTHRPNPPRLVPPMPADLHLPKPLAAYDISSWRFVAPGIQWARVAIPDDDSAKVLLLRAAPGTSLPLHTHTGTEYTCILHGAFIDDGQTVSTGDLVECDERHRHQPTVDMQGECICVLAVDGRLVMEGWLARLAQRIVGL